jgi:hypothetical protein
MATTDTTTADTDIASSRRLRRRRLARFAAATGLAVFVSVGFGAAPAHAIRWTKGTQSPYVLDCRSGTVCMRQGKIDWPETCKRFRDQHETFCENEGL